MLPPASLLRPAAERGAWEFSPALLARHSRIGNKPSPTVHALPLLCSFSGQYNFERESLAFALRCPQAFTIHSKE